METARQFITATAVSKAGRNGALGCWSFSIPHIKTRAAGTWLPPWMLNHAAKCAAKEQRDLLENVQAPATDEGGRSRGVPTPWRKRNAIIDTPLQARCGPWMRASAAIPA